MNEVLWVWTDENSKQAGIRILTESGTEQDIPLESLVSLRGHLSNAHVTGYGVRGKTGTELQHRKLIKETGKTVSSYTLMHADVLVCKVYPKENRVHVYEPAKLPFAFSGLMLTSGLFIEWLNARIDNLSRTYMNKVYIVRKVGRDRDKILRDSCAISPIDNFWIYRSDVDITWNELKRLRDSSLSLARVALTGEITAKDFTEAERGTTTLFTLKGAFPKAVNNGFILKQDNNAENEVAAYKLGVLLGISVAEASISEKTGIVSSKLFTSERYSLAHTRDLLHITDYNSGNDEEHRAIYEYFRKQGRDDLVTQLERLYIFNYLTENMDFHYENFGFIYDSETFKIIKVAPAYDFNSAFGGYNDVMLFYTWILKNLPNFMKKHPDIKNRLQSVEFSSGLNSLRILSETQKDSIRERARYLLSL